MNLEENDGRKLHKNTTSRLLARTFAGNAGESKLSLCWVCVFLLCHVFFKKKFARQRRQAERSVTRAVQQLNKRLREKHRNQKTG